MPSWRRRDKSDSSPGAAVDAYRQPAPIQPRPATELTRATPGAKRSSADIRRDIELQREQLGQSVELLRVKVNHLTDWRGHVSRHRRELAIGAAVTGFAVGGIIAALRRR